MFTNTHPSFFDDYAKCKSYFNLSQFVAGQRQISHRCSKNRSVMLLQLIGPMEKEIQSLGEKTKVVFVYNFEGLTQ